VHLFNIFYFLETYEWRAGEDLPGSRFSLGLVFNKKGLCALDADNSIIRMLKMQFYFLFVYCREHQQRWRLFTR